MAGWDDSKELTQDWETALWIFNSKKIRSAHGLQSLNWQRSPSLLPWGTHMSVSVCVCVCVCVCVYAQSRPTLCNPMDYSPPGSSVHGILQARILEWVAISYSKLSSCPRGRTCISCIGQRILYPLATWEVPVHGGHWLPRKGVFCVPGPLCQYIERFYAGTSN